jgi:hypothetical protein
MSLIKSGSLSKTYYLEPLDIKFHYQCKLQIKQSNAPAINITTTSWVTGFVPEEQGVGEEQYTLGAAGSDARDERATHTVLSDGTRGGGILIRHLWVG